MYRVGPPSRGGLSSGPPRLGGPTRSTVVKTALEAQIRDAELHKATGPDVDALIEKAMGYARALDKALRLMKSADLRAALRDLIDRVELYFRQEKRVDGKESSLFVRGFIYVKPGVLPEISTAACHDPEPCGSSPCRLNTSSDRR